MKNRFDNSDWTLEDLRTWAFAGKRSYSPQDFGLVIVATATIEDARFFLDLAADAQCPKRGFFLYCLYMFIADNVRGDFRRVSHQDLSYFVLRGEKFALPSVHQWVADSRQLIAEPQNLNYDDWFRGHLANHALERDEPSKL